MNIKWLKLNIEIFNDEKIKLIRTYPDGDKILVIWIWLLTMAMKSSDKGIIRLADGIPYTEDDLSAIMGIEKKTIQLALELFSRFNMIDITEGGMIEIINFRKHQSLDEIEYKQEKNREKVARFRERKKELELENDVTITRLHVTNRVEKIREDKNREEESRIDKNNTVDKPPRATFQKPSIDEVTSYCKERQNSVNPEKFINYYESNGWIVGKNKMKDWKACIRTWELNFYDNSKPIPKTQLSKGDAFLDEAQELYKKYGAKQ